MKTAQISKMMGRTWLLEISEDGRLMSESQHPSWAYARDAAKRLGVFVPFNG